MTPSKSSETNTYAEERRRILRAAADGRLQVNDSGRYVIVGDPKRPDRKVREKLMYHDPQFVTWPSWGARECKITIDGRGELRDLEAMLGDEIYVCPNCGRKFDSPSVCLGDGSSAVRVEVEAENLAARPIRQVGRTLGERLDAFNA